MAGRGSPNPMDPSFRRFPYGLRSRTRPDTFPEQQEISENLPTATGSPHSSANAQRSSSVPVFSPPLNTSRTRSEDGSRRSSKESQNSRIQVTEIELSTETEMANLQEQEEKLEVILSKINVAIRRTEQIIKENEDKLMQVESDQARSEPFILKIEKLKEDLQKLYYDKEIQEIEQQQQLKSIKRKRELLQKSLNLEKEKILVEDDQHLGSDDEGNQDRVPNLTEKDPDPLRVQMFVNDAADDFQKGNETLQQEFKEDQEKAVAAMQKAKDQAEATEARKIENVKVKSEKAAAQIKKMQEDYDQNYAEALQEQLQLEEELKDLVNKDKIPMKMDADAPVNPTAEDKEEKLIRMLAAAINSSKSQGTTQSDKTDKFLARQTHYKELPTFTGKPEEWSMFIADFNRSTEDCGWSNADNMSRLRRSLKGEAHKYVQSLLTNPEAVPTVIRKLQIRYGQPDSIIEAMINKVKVIPPFTEAQLESLIEFGSAVQNAVASIETLKQEEHLSNPSLLREFEKKLPSIFLMQWLNWVDTGEDRKRNLINFAGWLDKQTELACKACPVSLKGEESKQPPPPTIEVTWEMNKKGTKKKAHWENVKEDVPTAAGLAAVVKKQCVFCDMDNHASQNCFKAKKMSLEQINEKIKKKNACFRCLKPGHISRMCKVDVTCEICGKRHDTLVCFDKDKKNLPKNEKKPVEEPKQSCAVTHTSNLSYGEVILLKVVVVKVFGPNGSSIVRMLIDEGSQVSYIGSKTVQRTGCQFMGMEKVRNQLLGGYVTELHEENLRAVVVEDMSGKVRHNWTLREKPIVCTSLPRVPLGPWLEPLKKKNVWFSDLENVHVDEDDIEILIGSDLRGSIMTGNKVDLGNNLFAEETVFGWTLGGPLAGYISNLANMTISLFNQRRRKSIEDMWELEILGIKDPIEIKTRFQEEEAAKKHFLENVTRKDDGRYCVALPWISDKPELPSNYAIALKRLRSTTSKLKDKQAVNQYDAIFKGWEEEAIVESVCIEKVSKSHYLPHHPVFKPESKTTPVRPVFDASCKTANYPSLNNCLYKGPNLIELIPSILHRFREKRFGVSSDIRKAFQMIAVREEDKDYQRFLWWNDNNQEDLKVIRHCRVVFGVTSSPFLLGAVIELHLKQVKDDEILWAKKLLQSMYVDNSIISVDTMEEYQEFREVSTRVLGEAKMELREWEVSGIGSSRTSDGCGLGTEREDVDFRTGILGLVWDKREDTLSCDVGAMIVEGPWSKRKILSVVARIFDPIGFTCPATLRPKTIVQELWKKNKGWDDELEEDDILEFKTWFKDIQELTNIKIPRHMLLSPEPDDVQLHIFSDASVHAYAAVIYIRSVSESEVKVQLVQAKARVAPIKSGSIPRLELMGCVIGVRLLDLVRQSMDLKVNKLFHWTDSSTALAWIRRSDQWGTFVANRVNEIRRSTLIENWRHVPGVLNPADLPSRGCSPQQLVESRWWEGVNWLKGCEESWPSNQVVINEDEVKRELKGQKRTNLEVARQEPWYEYKFSSFLKNVKVMGWILRFVYNCKASKTERRKDKSMSQYELRDAEKLLLKRIQQESLIPNLESLKKKIKVVEKDGLLSVKTRLINKEGSELFRWPTIIPCESFLVKALIQEMHVNYGHPGVQFLLCKLRERYWILGGRRAVKSIIRKCPRCRRHDAKPIDVEPAALPSDRVTPAEVYQTTGVDLAGPVQLKDGSKAWIVLYTCAVYRCVHLDVVTSLSTEAFLGALERFINLYGRPKKFYSDNGTNFVGTVNLMKALNWKSLEEKFYVKAIRWTFNPPAAPWWGGFWERLVRSMKNQLRRILGNAKLTYDQLRTSLSTVQSTINDRPLTIITEDSGDLTPLTPSMFLHPTRSVKFPEGQVLCQQGLELTYKKMRSVQKQLQDRFRSEYLAQLVQRGKEKNIAFPKVGDLVLIGSDDKKRFQWPIGRIVELIPGGDGVCRVAKVQTAHDYVLKIKRSGKYEVIKVKKGHIMTRAFQRLFPLEISSPEDFGNPKKFIKPYVKKAYKKKCEKKSMDVAEPIQEVEVKTRSGRQVKRPSRYGQWITQMCMDEYD